MFLLAQRCVRWKPPIEQFQFRVFVVRDIRRTAVTELFRMLKMTLRVIFSILNNLSLRRNINLNIGKFTRANKPLFWQKWTPDVFSYFRPPCLCPSEGHKHGVILSSINLCGTFCQITRVRSAAQTWHLDRCLIYLSSIPCQFLDFIHGMVSIFFFNGVTVKTEIWNFLHNIKRTLLREEIAVTTNFCRMRIHKTRLHLTGVTNNTRPFAFKRLR